MLDEAGLEALRVQSGGTIHVIDFRGHQIVFRRPTRDHVRDFRRKEGTPAEADRVDQLTQFMLVACDGETGEKGRAMYLGFLEECPLFTDSAKCRAAVNTLAGITESADAEALGKFVRVLDGRRPSTQKDSPNGSATAGVTESAPTQATSQPS
jgi:hypothetical protein